MAIRKKISKQIYLQNKRKIRHLSHFNDYWQISQKKLRCYWIKSAMVMQHSLCYKNIYNLRLAATFESLNIMSFHYENIYTKKKRGKPKIPR